MKIALLIIYNHRFDKNIPILNRHYEGRFSEIWHIVPFYDGNEKNVIPVYESSYYFQGYICQAYNLLKTKGYSHYFIVADDMIINPVFNEKNLLDKLNIGQNDCYIDELRAFQNHTTSWMYPWVMAYNPRQKGVEVMNILPSYSDAKEKFAKYNIPTTPIPWINILKYTSLLEKIILLKNKAWHRNLKYPLVGSYSDICIITDNVMKKWCKYAGAFSATNLFVEVALPTALVLASDSIKQNRDIPYKMGALWGKEQKKFAEKYSYNLEQLIKQFPTDLMYVHPIKLSKWK